MRERKKKTTKTVEVSEETHRLFTYMAKAQNKKLKAFLGELATQLFYVASQFESDLTILYDGSFTGAWLRLSFVGQSKVEFGLKTEKGEDIE